MHSHRFGPILLAACLAVAGAAQSAEPLTRAQAVKALAQADATVRQAGIERLAEVGRMADAPQLVASLRDEEPVLREGAAAALWQIWGRSGDVAMDKLLIRGTLQMQASALDDARATFDTILRRRPAFAEAWNKRATVHYLQGHLQASLKDVGEALRRNPYHFGALSGAGRIHFELGNDKQAMVFIQRALAVNPNLEGLDDLMEQIQERMEERMKNST
jgi:tetratricopeptide (TPR) repeat protein